MDSEGIVKSVDGIYKNILEKFNPGAKQLIGSSKTYLKSLHSTSAASKVFIESLAKLAVNAHEGGTTDIGSALMDLVGVFSSIEDQHMNILKAFYVDFILPLETNLEKDTKVVQLEQKKFFQLHKQRVESFNKATTAMKKHRKKKNNAEKELKCIQALETEKKLLDGFCDQSIKNALIQERRRYGFVLERCVSNAKHWSQYFEVGQSSIDNNIEYWNEKAATREIIPTNAEIIGPRKVSEREPSLSVYGSVKLDAMRKSQSVHASTNSLRDPTFEQQRISRSRAMSEHSLVSSPQNSNNNLVVSSLYAYTSSGENQLSFFEADKILLIGEKTQGWQFGENMRSNTYGWFPISYVQQEVERRSSFKKSSEDLVENGSESRMTLRRNENGSHQRDSINRYQKIDNPPSSLPPPPPSNNPGTDSMRINGSASANFSKSTQNGARHGNKPSIHAIYSSNDSGFSNELMPPAAPEVDYSDDDDLPKKIPIREPNSDKNVNASSDNEDNFTKSTINMKSNSFGNLTETNRNHDHSFNIDSTTMKRNKSFWRFSKSEDILEGMALWKHRDLVPIDIEAMDKEQTLKKNQHDNNLSMKMDTLQRKTSRLEESNRKMETLKNDKREMGGRIQSFNNNYNKASEMNKNLMHRNDDDEIYDETPKRRNDMGPSKAHSQKSKSKTNNEKYSREIQDTNFYDDDVMVVKTVKRKEILKQYYSSGTDTELSSSDPYDCIVVDDHLVPSTSTFRNRNSYAEPDKRGSLYSRKNDVSGTLLPRTKLTSKTSRIESVDDRMNTTRSNKTNKSNFGPWSNLWPDE